MNIKILPYESEFEQALIAILQQNVPTYFAPAEVDDLRDYLRNHIDQYFVVFDNDRLIGGGGINRTKETNLGVLSWAFLHPDYHRKGIGSTLLNYRIDLLKADKDIKYIHVRTSQVVYEFFEKQGFELVNKQKDYWAKGFDLYEMTYKK